MNKYIRDDSNHNESIKKATVKNLFPRAVERVLIKNVCGNRLVHVIYSKAFIRKWLK